MKNAVRIVTTIARHPALWPTAFVQARRFAPPGWWRERPYLPIPPAAYIRFRIVTHHGRTDAAADPVDVLNYLAWCREWNRHTG